MARRNRRRSRPRNSYHRSHNPSISSNSSTSTSTSALLAPSIPLPPTNQNSIAPTYWQNWWNAWPHHHHNSFSRGRMSYQGSILSVANQHLHDHAAPFVHQGNQGHRHYFEPKLAAPKILRKETVRLFGGDEKDGDMMCGSMIQVVKELFDGNLDYEL